MRVLLLALVIAALAGCNPDWGGNSATEQLDNTLLEGCYEASGLPNLRFEGGQVRSDNHLVYNRYDYVRAGRDSATVVIVQPRNGLIKRSSGDYAFEQTMSEGGNTFSYDVGRSGSETTISIISSPDAVRHDYKRVPCTSPTG